MSWVAVGVTGAGLATSVMSNKAKAKENQRQADIAAAQTQYSPWTGLAPQAYNPQSIDAGGDAMKAITSGVMSGVMHNKANPSGAEPKKYSSYGSADEANAAAQIGSTGNTFDWSGLQKKKTLYPQGGSGFGSVTT